MNHTCKVCRSTYTEKPRFCPECGSYFIDADDPFDGKEWRGVIRSDGTLAKEAIANVTRKRKNGRLPAGKVGSRVPTGGKVWSILSLVAAGVVFLLNIISFFAKEPFFLLGIPNFVFCIIILGKASGWMKKTAGILIILSLVVGAMAIMVM